MIEITEVRPTNEFTTVYNLRVSDHHTYFVGGTIWGWDVWVHNAYTFRGGAHGDTKLPWRDGLESHHMPAKSITGLDEDLGPAIQMSRIDHLKTSSHGSRSGSAIYRADIENLLNKGQVRKAMAIEIRDVRRAALQGSGDIRKYNQAVREMLEYARSIGYIK